MKISNLDLATSIDGTEVLPIVQSGQTKKFPTSGMRPYRVWSGWLTDSGGIADPSVETLENTIGGTLTISKASTGQINFQNSPGTFPTGKVPTMSFEVGLIQSSTLKFAIVEQVSTDLVRVVCNDSNANSIDITYPFFIEIRVYP